MNGKKLNLTKIVFIGMLAAIVCVVTLYRFPLLGSKVHFANGVCLLSGLLMGPFAGGLAAGLGSALYDALLGGYGAVECVVTFVSKFAMAWVCGMIAFSGKKETGYLKAVLATLAGALTYAALYLAKSYFYSGLLVGGLTPDAAWLSVIGKLPATIFNAAVAIIFAPILAAAIKTALKRNHLSLE